MAIDQDSAALGMAAGWLSILLPMLAGHAAKMHRRRQRRRRLGHQYR